MLLTKKCQFFSLFTIYKKRLEIMLGDFAEKKETLSHFKQQSFLKSKKSDAFGQKMPTFSSLRFGQNKTRNNAF